MYNAGAQIDQFIRRLVSHGTKLEESDISALSEAMHWAQHGLEHLLFSKTAVAIFYPTLQMAQYGDVSRVQNRSYILVILRVLQAPPRYRTRKLEDKLISMDADHINMTKFKGPQDPGYVAVLKEMRRIIEELEGKKGK